jgi:hypothetical protein
VKDFGFYVIQAISSRFYGRAVGNSRPPAAACGKWLPLDGDSYL